MSLNMPMEKNLSVYTDGITNGITVRFKKDKVYGDVIFLPSLKNLSKYRHSYELVPCAPWKIFKHGVDKDLFPSTF